jgi:multiple antibiotic resistance protein
MTKFWLCFVPLFVAVDAVGVLPLFMSFTEGFKRQKVNKIILQSVLTAAMVAILFLAIGRAVFKLLGISIADFMIAGGVLLFAFSLRDLLSMDKRRRIGDIESLGSVPIGVPLIVGPAVLTTVLLLMNNYGIGVTILATVLNILIAGFIFLSSESIYRVLGKAGAKTVSKIASLLLAAIAVMMIRKGILVFLQGQI